MQIQSILGKKNLNEICTLIFFFLSNMVILHHSYLFAIVVLIAKVVSAIGRWFSVVQGSIECAKYRVGKIAPARRRARVTYRLIDETSIFQKASAIAAVQISAQPNISIAVHIRAK